MEDNASTTASERRARWALVLSLVWPVLAVTRSVEIPLLSGFSRSFGALVTFGAGIGCAVAGIVVARRERKTVGATGVTTAAEILGWIGVILGTVVLLALLALMILWARSDWTF